MGGRGFVQMLNEERRNRIQEVLAQQHRLLVTEMAAALATTPVTIRKDLEVLEKRGLCQRVHGGAILNQSSVIDIALTEKERLHAREKERIARVAEKLINDGEVIILDSGSTTTAIARRLKTRRNITVITNAVNIAWELAASDNEVILIGGTVREKSFSLVGPISEAAISRLMADKLFLGVDGIDLETGYTTPNLLEANINRLMLKSAAEVIVVADSSKLGRKSMGVIAEISAAQHIITDEKIAEQDLLGLRALGIKVTKA
jgi:DeoR family transcriptional regulator, aga operon transcriptional repressor